MDERLRVRSLRAMAQYREVLAAHLSDAQGDRLIAEIPADEPDAAEGDGGEREQQCEGCGEATGE
jgi:hypothetical protein